MVARQPTWLRPPLTRVRVAVALVTAVVADGLQLALGPLGWLFVDEAIDVVAAIVTIAALGFHILLLPTFALKLLPVVDALPTWTGCVITVAALRRREWSRPPVEVI